MLARGLAHPVVFMGGNTPRALDGVVDGVVERSKEGDERPMRDSRREGSEEMGKRNGDIVGRRRDVNGMRTFFSKVIDCGQK